MRSSSSIFKTWHPWFFSGLFFSIFGRAVKYCDRCLWEGSGRKGLPFLAKLKGRFAEKVFEGLGKMALVRKTQIACNGSDRVVGLGQHVLGYVDFF